MTRLDAPSLQDQTPALPRQFSLPGKRGFFALGDQAVLSLGNFLTNLALARTMAKEPFGNYGTVLTFLLFLNNLHMAVVTYPLSITAGMGDPDEFRRRTRRAVAFTLMLVLPFSLLLAWPTARIAGWGILPAVIVALTLWQIQETLRRAMLSQLRHDRAIAGDAISYLGQAAVVWAFAARGVSLPAVFWIIAVTSAGSIVVQSFQLRWLGPTHAPEKGQTLTAQAVQHWSLGKWVLSANLVNVVTVYSIPWVVRYRQGPAEVAALYAVLALLNASNPVLSSVAGLVTPAVANSAGRGHHAARRIAVRYALGGAALLVPFFIVLLIVPHWILTLAYKSSSPYVVRTLPMRLYTLCYAVTYASAMLASYLCGLGKSRLPLYGQIANAVVTVALTLHLAARFGVTGAAVGTLIAGVCQLACNMAMVRRKAPN